MAQERVLHRIDDLEINWISFKLGAFVLHRIDDLENNASARNGV